MEFIICSNCHENGHSKSTCLQDVDCLNCQMPTSLARAKRMIESLREDRINLEEDLNFSLGHRHALEAQISKQQKKIVKLRRKLENPRQPMNDYIKKRMRNDLWIEARKNWQSNKTEDFKETTECPICCIEVEHDKMEFQPCGHHFCDDCLSKTIDKCAICRQ